MHYAELLRHLRDLTARGNDVFSVNMVLAYLDAVKLSEGPEAEYKIPVENLTIKRVSNDLNRLYRMQLLKRKRMKRYVTTKTGKVCGRGYCYEYNLTKQGLKYSKYLIQPLSLRVINQELTRKQHFMLDPDNLPIIANLKNIPPDNQEYVSKLLQGLGVQQLGWRLKGRYNRFPPKADYPILFRAIQQNRDFQKLILEISEKVDKGVTIKQKLEEDAQLMLDIMEDGPSLLKLARVQFAKKGINPAIWADNTFARGSKEIINAKSGTFLLLALDWILQELERNHIKPLKLS